MAQLREHLAARYEKEEAWSAAAAVLAGIDLESGQRVLEPAFKLATCVRVAQLYLEDDDAANADTFLKRAGFLLAEVGDPALELQYNTCFARILDAKRRFLEAATRYHALSQLAVREIGGRIVAEEELVEALNAAVVCAVLAAAGPQRSRVLATLYKDARCAALPTYDMLQQVHLGRLLRPAGVAVFAEQLRPHQLATGGDGLTVLGRAVLEHNVTACAKLYRNIAFGELGALLGCSEGQAAKIAAKMVVEGRLKGCIDEVAAMLFFEDEEEDSFDAAITSICLGMQAAVDKIEASA